VLIEKHEGTSWHPKTRNFNTRTMEIARGWGVAVYERLRAIDTPPGWKSPIRFTRTAIGEELGVIESKGFEGPGPDVSPALPVMSSQELIEAILLDAVRATGMVDVRFATEATRLVRGGRADDESAGIEIRSHATGATEVIAGRALVGADGSASLVRRELGVELEGAKELRHIVNCYFRADVERHLGGRKGVLFFVANERANGVLQPLDGAGRWLCQIAVQPAEWSLDVFSHDRARAWIRAAVGAEELEPEVLSLGLWQLNATVAERFVQGRVLLCVDAAHQFPPTGGLGVNTGLQGMHNAMWKVAWWALGRAGWPLVTTYETERRGVAQRITQQSLQNSINVALIGAAAAAGAEGP
jgi:2-polyprenyl-6-methoxyphenol hydroxylase-like FAD-dependent oxidoreductase